MIHNVQRHLIRMKSGEVIVSDPLKVWENEAAMPKDLREHMRIVDRFLGGIEGGYFVTYAYATLHSVGDRVPTAIVAANISTITSVVSQIEAREGAFS